MADANNFDRIYICHECTTLFPSRTLSEHHLKPKGDTSQECRSLRSDSFVIDEKLFIIFEMP
jgi:hypothetical protein